MNHQYLHSLCRTWHILLNKKKILSKTIFERIRKEQLRDSTLKDPVPKSSIERLGYYDVAYELTPDQQEVLSDLVKFLFIRCGLIMLVTFTISY